MELNKKMRNHWYQLMLELFGVDLKSRLNAAWPLYGLCWCLILVNEFREDVWARRRGIDVSRKDLREQILIRQLDRSRNILLHINESVLTQTFDFQYNA